MSRIEASLLSFDRDSMRCASRDSNPAPSVMVRVDPLCSLESDPVPSVTLRVDHLHLDYRIDVGGRARRPVAGRQANGLLARVAGVYPMAYLLELWNPSKRGESTPGESVRPYELRCPRRLHFSSPL